MSPPLEESTAQFLVYAVKRLGAEASFGRILLEANREGVLAWHRTLRRYLDLLVQGPVLRVEKRNVGSVNPQQLYTVRNKQATVWTGPRVLKEFGLRRDVEDSDMYAVEIDLEGLIQENRRKPKGRTVRRLIQEWGTTRSVTENLVDLHKTHRFAILREEDFMATTEPVRGGKVVGEQTYRDVLRERTISERRCVNSRIERVQP